MTNIWTTHLPIRFRSTMLIALSLLATVLVYVLAAYLMVLSNPSETTPTFQQSTLIRVFYGVAVVVSIGVIVGRRALFSASRLWHLVESHGLNRLIDELASKTILLVALSEVVGVLGLVLSLMTKTFDPMWRLGAVSVLLILYNVPRRSAWERTVEEFSRYTYEEPKRVESK